MAIAGLDLDLDRIGRRRTLAAAGALLVLAGLVVANLDLEAGDNYCGSVFSDSSWVRACDPPLRSAAVVTAVCVLCGLAALSAAAISGKTGRDRMLAFGAFALAVVGVAALLASANRLVEPTDDAWCGSVVNRHRFYDLSHEAACDRALAPHRRQALGAGAVAAVALVAAGATEWRRRAHRAQTASSGSERLIPGGSRHP